MNINNGSEFLIIVVFSMTPQLGGIGIDGQDLLDLFRDFSDKLLAEADVFCHFGGLSLCNAKQLQF